jgi:AcrR family transcriptional regulator
MARQSPRRRLQDPEVRRAEILDEAIRIVGERGYHGFAVLELAQRCGLTNGGLLYHFGSKEQLLLAVLEEHDRRLTGDMIATLGPELRTAKREGAPLTAVFEVLRSIVQRASAIPELTRLYAVLQAEALDPSHPAHDYFVAREALTLGGFEALVGPHVDDPRAVARQLHALMDGLGLQWLRAGSGFDLVAAWDQAVSGIAWRDGRGQGEGTE